MGGSAKTPLVKSIADIVDTRFTTFFPPEEIVLSQDSPTTAGLCGASQVARREETKHVQGQFFG